MEQQKAELMVASTVASMAEPTADWMVAVMVVLSAVELAVD